MSDPFSENNSEQQLMRESKIGFSVLLLVIVAAGFWCYSHYAKFRYQLPPHIANAPVANHVGPEYYLRKLHQENPVRTFDYPDSRIAQSAPPVQPMRTAATPKQHTAINPFAPELDIREPAKSAPPTIPRTARLVPAPATSKPNPQPPSSSDISKNDFESRAAKQIKKAAADTLSFFGGSKKTETSEDEGAVVPASYEEIETRPLPEIVPASKADPINQRTSGASFKKPPGSFKLTDQDHKMVSDTKSFRPRATALSQDFQPVQGTKSESESDQVPPLVISEPNVQTNNLSDQATEPESTTTKLKEQPKAQPFAAAGSEGQYQTSSGDSFWSIAQQLYDDGRLFRALFEHNRTRVTGFDSLTEGTKLVTPSSETLRSLYPDLCPRDLADEKSANEYRTFEGDTLFNIARQTTGQASRYLEILKLNRDRLPKNINHLSRLPAGLSLQLPE